MKPSRSSIISIVIKMENAEKRKAIVDLHDIPIVDHHCHAFFRPEPSIGMDRFLRIFTESDFPESLHQHIPHTLYYRKAIRYLAEFFACDPTLQGVLAARRRYGEAELLRRLIEDARIETLLLDTGFPTGGYTPAEMESLLPCRIGRILRLEKLGGELLPECTSFHDLEHRMIDAVVEFASEGGVALKSIIAYRSGLAVAEVGPGEAERAFRHLRQTRQGSPVRIASKPLLDALLLSVLEMNRDLGLPVQFHTGFGDKDIDLLKANPLLLGVLFGERKFQEFPIVLLHAGYPYIREAGYLVNIYPNIYVDVSLSVPLIHGGGAALFRQLFELAPSTKILYASDGHSFPESYWLGAKLVRETLTQVLSEFCVTGVLDEAQARKIGAEILCENARRIYF
jgi:predicted TIM-barrel fold metal-dependent hydrolase